jgi:mono/diheme cytochrome c family protein
MKFHTHLSRVLLTVAPLLGSLAAHAQAAPQQSRGELLYSTHCISCHTTQMHWRNDRQAQDWDTLKLQVRRWQGNAGLDWDEADVAEVARHLNDTIYRFPQTSDRLSLAR